MEAKEEKVISTKPFGWRDKIGYMFGDVANNMTFMLASSFLMVFYTEVLYIEGAIVGTLFVVARVVDAFSDVFMGKIIDYVDPTKEGKFKPWIRRIAGPVALFSFLMYQSAMVNAPMWMRIVYMYVTYLLWGSVFYTAINIPYGSMASVISPDPDDRTSLSVLRGAGGTIAGMILGVLTPLLIYTTDAAGNQVVRGGWAFPAVAGMFALLAILFYFITYKWTTERVKVKKVDKENQVPFMESMKNVITSRSLVSIMVASVLLLMTMLSIQQLINYLFPFYYGSAVGISVAMFAQTGLSLLIGMPLASWLGRVMGKKEAGAIGMFIGSALYFVLYFMRPENMYVYIAFSSIAFIALSLFNGTVWASVTDVIDDHEVRTGERADGTIYGVNSFSRKVGQALAGGIGGYALTFIGYESGATTQAAGVLTSLYDVTVLIPAIGFLLCGLVLVFWYPLSKKKTKENQRILAERAVEED